MSYLTYTLHRLVKPDLFAKFDWLLLQQNKTQKILLEDQARALNLLVDSAQRKSRYYSEKLAHIRKDSLGNIDFTSVPILRKDDVINNIESMVINDAGRKGLFLGKTGGSTGKPVAFYYDRNAIVTMLAGVFRCYSWAGWRPGDKVLNLWGARQDFRGAGKLKSIVSSWISSDMTIGVYEFSEEHLKQWVNTIITYRPVLIQG
jgi:phenylacetate-CoA ligase